jgi:hypothetical protein
LQLGFYVLPTLVGRAPVDAIFTGATFEEGGGKAVKGERGDDSPSPEEKACFRRAKFIEEIFV